jgi:hypothetical protein
VCPGEYAKHGRLRDGGTVEQAEAGAARAWLADTLRGWESLLMVRDNTGADRVSTELRAELVALCMVSEAGVALGRPGWEGVVAGVEDLVQKGCVTIGALRHAGLALAAH